MAVDPTIATVLANEARKLALKTRIGNLQGQVAASASLMTAISGVNRDARESLDSASAELSALEAGAGQGITDDFGERSDTDQALRAERFAGKAAAVAFVKEHPDCSEAEAVSAWTAAVPAPLLQNVAALVGHYRNELLQARLITDDTWESHRAYILAHR